MRASTVSRRSPIRRNSLSVPPLVLAKHELRDVTQTLGYGPQQEHAPNGQRENDHENQGREDVRVHNVSLLRALGVGRLSVHPTK